MVLKPSMEEMFWILYTVIYAISENHKHAYLNTINDSILQFNVCIYDSIARF